MTTASLDTAATRLMRSLERLESEGYEVLPEMRTRAASLAAAVFDEATVYASPALTEEGGLSLHWVGDKRSMEIELVPGDLWFYFLGDNGRHISKGGEGPLPEELLRAQIADFSAYVNAANPNWRKTLADHP